MGTDTVSYTHLDVYKRQMLDICDEMGIIVMDELFDMWTVHKNSHDFALHFLDEWEKVTTRKMCIRDRYKTAPSEEEQEKARQEYLDKRGVSASYRW